MSEEYMYVNPENIVHFQKLGKVIEHVANKIEEAKVPLIISVETERVAMSAAREFLKSEFGIENDILAYSVYMNIILTLQAIKDLEEMKDEICKPPGDL